MQRVAVVVPVVNCNQHTRNAIASIREQLVPATPFILDNASTDGVSAWAELQRDCFYVRHETNIGVARAWNRGIAWAFKMGFEHVFVMNNDVVLAPDTIRALLQWRQEGCAVPTVHPVYGPSLERWKRKHRLVHPADFCGFLLGPDVIRRVGWFDAQFMPAYFEDVDYEHRLVLANLGRGQVLDAPVRHIGSRTTVEGGVRLGKAFNRNRERLVAKWGKIPSRERPSGPKLLKHLG